MSSATTPRITVDVTFLSSSEGGRSKAARNSPQYRPHLVVGDPAQRVALTAADGRTLLEDYLGVCFAGDGEELLPGQRYEIDLLLVYAPQVNYDALRPGASFTIREGGRVVGFGSVRGANE
jgi:hypothetical protein